MTTVETRWCDQGCGYKLPNEYAAHETTCGACLNDLGRDGFATERGTTHTSGHNTRRSK